MNFKDYSKETQEQVIIDSVLLVKQLTEKPLCGFKWNYDNSELTEILKQKLIQPSDAVTTLATREIYQNKYTRTDFLYTIDIFTTSTGQIAILHIEYPGLWITNYIKEPGMTNLLYARNNVNMFANVFEVTKTGVSYHLHMQNSVLNINSDEDLNSLGRRFAIADRIGQMSNVLHMDEIIDVLQFAGLSNRDVIKLKIKHGVPLKDEELTDETLAGIV